MSGFRSKLQTAGVTIIVVLISAVFILEFGGPQSQGCNPEGGGSIAATVHGEPISMSEFRAAYTLANGTQVPAEQAREMQLKERVLGGLVERNLLAREARALGFHVEESDVMQRLAEDGTIYMSAAVGSPYSIPRGAQTIRFEDEDGQFDAKEARRFIQNRLGRSVEEFALSQIEETLAQRMRETYAATVTLSPEEAWSAFERERERATLKYARFDAAFYAAQVDDSDEAIEAWMAEHEDAVKAEYDKQKHRYTGLEKQVRARHILIKPATADDEAAKAAAQQQAEELRQRAVAGEDFAKLAEKYSQDPGSAIKGGDLGYNVKGRMVAPFDEAQFALEVGGISEVVESQFGFHVIKVEGIREGDVPLAEAERELAQTLYVDARALELAEQAASQALGELSGGASWDDLDTQLGAQAEASGKKSLAPSVKETRSFGRTDSPIPGLDASKLVEKAFELTLEAPRGEAPMQVGKSFVIYELTDRQRAEREDFEGEEQQRLHDALLNRKRSEALDQYIYGLRRAAEAAGEISLNPEATQYPVPRS